MQTKLYVIYDVVAQEAGPVYQAPNDGVAKRNYNATMSKVPPSLRTDYKLFRIGEVSTLDMQGFFHDPEEIKVELEDESNE